MIAPVMTRQPPDASSGSAPSWPLWRTLLCVVLLAAAVEVALALIAGNLARGKLLDPDCYLHLQRALRLLTGTWQEGGFEPRINAPFGFSVHWTSLFDGLLVLMATPFTWAGLAPRDAVYAGGIIISPVLLILSLCVLAVGVRRWLPGPAFLLLVVLFFTQPHLSGAFLAGRPDHHSLIMGLFLVQLAWLYGMCSPALRSGRVADVLALVAGVTAGLQLATTVEGLLIILMVSLILALGWLWLARDLLRPLLLYWLGALGMIILWLAASQSEAFFTPAYDRVSIVHVAVLASGVAGLLLARFLSTRLSRVWALAAGGALALALVAALYPDFFRGPWAHVGPAIRAWHREIGELQPLLPTSAGGAAAFLGQFAAALFALPLMLHLLRRGDDSDRLAMLVSACGLVLFGGLSLAQMRWSGGVQAVMLLPWTLTVLHIMRSSMAWAVGRWRLPLRTPLVMAALLVQIVPSQMMSAQAQSGPGTDCDWTAAANALAVLPDQRGIVLTELWHGPEILWRTGFDVVAGPYEMEEALRDTQRFEQGDLAARREVLARRGIALVLSCGPVRDAQALGLQPQPFAVPGLTLYRAASAR